MARPRTDINSKDEKEKIERFLQYIRVGNYIETACRASGIPKNTFYRWMEFAREGDPEFVELAKRVDEATAQAEVNMVGCVHGAALAGDAKTALEWLGRVYPDRWGKKTQIDIDHKIDHLVSQMIDKLRTVLPPAQFRQVMKEFNKMEGVEEVEATAVPLLESGDDADLDAE